MQIQCSSQHSPLLLLQWFSHCWEHNASSLNNATRSVSTATVKHQQAFATVSIKRSVQANCFVTVNDGLFNVRFVYRKKEKEILEQNHTYRQL